MERKNLTGYRFKCSMGDECQIIAGYEHSEVVYEKLGKSEPLFFCCDAEIISGKPKGSYCISYTVTREEFFADIENLVEKSKNNADTIASVLREKYYKVPTVFLKLIGEAYLKGAK